MSGPIACPDCAAPLPATLAEAPGLTACPNCQTPVRFRAYPALLRPVTTGRSGKIITDASQAACFYHPTKTAQVPCDGCGRFICALCEVELQGQHLCPSCLESGRRKGTLLSLENKRTLWDNVALSTAVLPLIVPPLTLISAPTAIFFSIYGRRKPRSLVPRRAGLTFGTALFLAIAQLIGWGVLAFFVITEGFE